MHYSAHSWSMWSSIAWHASGSCQENFNFVTCRSAQIRGHSKLFNFVMACGMEQAAAGLY